MSATPAPEPTGALDAPDAPGRGPDPRAERSRAAALAAARDLLVEQGWSAVTHVAVAARSGVGRSTLYRHWPDASGLVRDVIAQRISTARVPLTGVLREDLVHQLDGLRHLLHDPVSDRGLRAVIERAGVDPVFARLKEDLYRHGSQDFRTILEAARTRGELAPDLDVDLAVDQLAGPLMYRRLLAGRPVTEEYARQVVDDFLTAHAPRGTVRDGGRDTPADEHPLVP
uniref:TetR family transcriptional regulator n=1 Tax=Streptomyces griseoruber TaxID=1943 RepID=A0A1S6QMQ8_9ACTN|nr:TetR family transcriptional regulator [Streptomyces griseoruber]